MPVAAAITSCRRGVPCAHIAAGVTRFAGPVAERVWREKGKIPCGGELASEWLARVDGNEAMRTNHRGGRERAEDVNPQGDCRWASLSVGRLDAHAFGWRCRASLTLFENFHGLLGAS